MKISLNEAFALLMHGEVVAVPTETVYGLAAPLFLKEAIEKIFQLKKRPSSNPLIIHVADRESVHLLTKALPPQTELLMDAFWPGPLTFVLEAKEELIPAIVRANLKSAAFRMPAHEEALLLIKKTGPLVMPSANLSGRPSSTRSFHVEEDFGPLFPVLEGAFPSSGVESTILIFKERWQIIRQGAVTALQLENLLGYSPLVYEKMEGDAPLCPGQLYRHYAPRAALEISEAPSSDAEAIVGFSDRTYPKEYKFYSLGRLHLPEEVAGNLYFILRKLDEEGVKSAWVDLNFEPHGLLSTVKERLLKATESK